MFASIVDQIADYPSPSGQYSPNERYPEYRYAHLSGAPNPVYSAVRRSFAQAGLDGAKFGTPGWNPLGQWVAPGADVFILCNFVYHRRPGESDENFLGKCTHAGVLRPLIDYLLIAVGPQGRVRFGNAPIQACDWARVLRETSADVLLRFYQALGEPVQARDLRLLVSSRSRTGRVRHEERRNESAAVSVELGRDSFLAGLPPGSFRLLRVSDYDSRKTVAWHGEGQHTYLVNREVLDADVVVSVPKLKTHEKVGLTLALKGCVGAVASKECLAHHRRGLPSRGGDEYRQDATGLKRVASALHDWVQVTDPRGVAGRFLRVPDRILRSLLHRYTSGIGGSWSGNDTAWRMALDLARILSLAAPDGSMGERVVRQHLVLLDGVVGGEGEGPLRPTAVRSGFVMFSDNPVLADHAAARLVGFAPDRLALLREAGRAVPSEGWREARIVCFGRELKTADDLPVVRRFRPPRGWEGASIG